MKKVEISSELVEKLAYLSKLQFDAAEKNQIQQDLENMVGFIDQLGALDLSDTKPLIHLSDQVNNFRPKGAVAAVSAEDAVKNAPDKDGNFFKVPKVL